MMMSGFGSTSPGRTIPARPRRRFVTSTINTALLSEAWLGVEVEEEEEEEVEQCRPLP